MLRVRLRSSVASVARQQRLAPAGRRFLAASAQQKLSESFLDGQSAEYVEAMEASWKKDPNSVHAAWAAYFARVYAGAAPGSAYQSPPFLHGKGSGASNNSEEISKAVQAALAQFSRQAPSVTGDVSGNVSAAQAQAAGLEMVNLQRLVQAYRTHGHGAAKLDPLGLRPDRSGGVLDHKKYGFTDADLDRSFYVGDSIYSVQNKTLPLREIIQRLSVAYCGSIGMEFEHIKDEGQKQWIREQFEPVEMSAEFSTDEKLALLDRLSWADGFEKFLKKKYGQDKRFGLDGGEILVPAMKTLIDRSATHGVETVVMGMPHRGRLNVLANVLRKPLAAILHEFEKKDPSDYEKAKTDFSFSGDVKYHLGTSCDRPAGGESTRFVHLSLLANPSHLEAVDPVVEGKTRAKQDFSGDSERKHTMSIQLHGDAAFAGQGIVYETLQMSGLEHYTTGGTIHIIVNNQIGFTTLPHRSARGQCTDVAKSAELPVFHVNGDDPEAVIRVARMAADWRARFHKDAVIDIVCYRRHGHNELDEPKFTQPKMYKKIASHPDTMSIYSGKLIEEGLITKEYLETEVEGKVASILEDAFVASKDWEGKKDDWLSVKWKGFHGPAQRARIKHTGVKMETLVQVGRALSGLPDHIHAHPAVKRDMKRKHDAVVAAAAADPSEKLVDWATAEGLAFGTLLLEGNDVRLSGQDVERGTFSHRHSTITDQVTGELHVPLRNISKNQGRFSVCNSLLSEFGVLGFEAGYALENPNALVLWEAQFGDFANGAQVIIDQFITAGEAKWKRQCGLVMLLPHGYDGQGPEHSSARLERFLLACDGDSDEYPFGPESDLADKEHQIQISNLQVVNCSTPASYFHVLRRQIHRTFRKPLIVMSPKKLLRHPLCKSAIDEFDDVGSDDRFERVLGETDEAITAKSKNVRKVVFCSGNVYYDLLEERTKRGITDVALIRLEQIAPFPWLSVKRQLDLYNPKAQVIWCQEEPKNMGAWCWTEPRLRTLLREEKGKREPVFVGRPPSASPATGSSLHHKIELKEFMDVTFA